MFRVKTTGGQWVTTPPWEDVTGVSDDKKDAYIHPDSDLEYYEDDPDLYKIVPLAVDEVMVKLGAPRLPGFEEV